MSRLVILLAGPSGAGKSTWAHRAGFDVYDWESARSEKRFAAGLARIAATDHIRIVVERRAPTIKDRLRLAELCRATHVFVLPTIPDTCHTRIKARGRPSANGEHRTVQHWWHKYEPCADHPVAPDPYEFAQSLEPLREW